jgi:hypothetical protein
MSTSPKMRRKKDLERFWSKVTRAKPSECWEWNSAKDEKGYGLFWLEGQSRRAHPLAYMDKNGDIPEGMQVLHSCDNPPCCNPRHLFLGTNDDNVGDKVRKGRQARNAGERCGTSKLTERDVKEIRRLRGEGQTLREIGKQFNVTLQLVHLIYTRKAWAHVP